jgi:hypothetical protein
MARRRRLVEGQRACDVASAEVGDPRRGWWSGAAQNRRRKTKSSNRRTASPTIAAPSLRRNSLRAVIRMTA